MGISGIHTGGSPAFTNVNRQAGDADPQIKVLEQKVRQLNTEKEKAAKSHDEEKAKRIEAQIREIKQQIELLKSRKSEDDNKSEENKKS